jgi:hypothetical protein
MDPLTLDPLTCFLPSPSPPSPTGTTPLQLLLARGANTLIRASGVLPSDLATDRGVRKLLLDDEERRRRRGHGEGRPGDEGKAELPEVGRRGPTAAHRD